MGAREIVRSILSAGPFQSALGHMADLPLGVRALNRLNYSGGVFSSFEEAWAAAGRGKHAGHEHPDAVKIHLELSKGLRPSDYPVLFWLLRISPRELHLFDYGGNAGNLYYSYSGYLREQVGQICWTVFDLPGVVQEGRRLGSERSAVGLRFADSPSQYRENEILLISGAFHYWEKSVAAFLGQFPALPRHIILNRSPVHQRQRSYITVQRTGTYAVPCIVRNEAELRSEFAAAGYVLMDQWLALELSLRMPLFPRHAVDHYSGFYFRLEKQS